MKTLQITELRAKYSETFNRVAFNNQTIMVERHGKPLAVIMPLEEYEKLKRIQTYLVPDAILKKPNDLR